MRLLVSILLLFALATTQALFHAEAGETVPVEVIRNACTDWPQTAEQRWRSVTVPEDDVLNTAWQVETAEGLTFKQIVSLPDQPGCYAVVWIQDDFPPGPQAHR